LASKKKTSLLRKEFLLGVINGIIFYPVVVTFSNADLVLVVFASRLTDSDFLLGLIVPLTNAGWMLLQLPGARILERSETSIWLYSRVAVIRMMTWVAFILVMMATQNPMILLVAFFAFTILRASVRGFAGISFQNVVGKTIKPDERGLYFSLRMTFGSLLAIGANAIVGYALSDESPWPFPQNFALMLAFGAFLMGIANIAFMVIDEPREKPIHESPKGPRTIRGFWKGTCGILGELRDIFVQDKTFRRLAISGVLLTLSGTAIGFFVIYAERRFEIPTSAVQTFLDARTLASLLTYGIAGWLSMRVGNKKLSIWGGLIGILPYVLILTANWLDLDPETAQIVFVFVYLLQQIAASFYVIGNGALKMNNATPERRAFYLGALNTVIGLASTAAGMFGGVVADVIGLEGLFIISITLNVTGLWLLLPLRDPAFDPAPRREKETLNAAQETGAPSEADEAQDVPAKVVQAAPGGDDA
jgi:MFS family permease